MRRGAKLYLSFAIVRKRQFGNEQQLIPTLKDKTTSKLSLVSTHFNVDRVGKQFVDEKISRKRLS